MDKNIDEIIECYNCGLFIKKHNDTNTKTQKCPRCNSKIKAQNRHSFDSLYYAVSALLLFGILNVYPIITLNINETDL